MNNSDSILDQIDVTVLMPVYNGEDYLNNAIDSVLNQVGISGIELLIINDGSKDRSADILNSYQDSRIKILHQSNVGLAKTLNIGLNIALGRYIARHDQDDVMLPGRLEKQFQFLEENPKVGMIGTWAEIYKDLTYSGRAHDHPIDSQILQARLLFDNPFVHSSVMMRADLIRGLGGYSIDKSRQPPEDYELWSRVARVSRVANLPERLTIYREVSSSMSRIPNNPFLEKILKISSENIYIALNSKYKIEDCYWLTSIYHGIPNFQKKIIKTTALKMLTQTLEGVWGNSSHWSEAMQVEAINLNKRFIWQYRNTVMPAKLIFFMKKLYKIFLKIYKFFLGY